MHRLRIALLVTGALTLSAPALADDSSEGRGGDHRGKSEKHDKSHKHDKPYERDSHDDRARHDSFDDHDHGVVRDYYGRKRGHVPPGLAKKGGVPPGLAKKGEVLPVEYRPHMLPLPPDLEKLLPPPPHEVIRRIIGRDIVLIQKQTNKVLDVMRDALP